MRSLVKLLEIFSVVAMNLIVIAEPTYAATPDISAADHVATTASIIGHRDVAPLDPVAVETVTKRWLGNPPDVVESLSTKHIYEIDQLLKRATALEKNSPSLDKDIAEIRSLAEAKLYQLEQFSEELDSRFASINAMYADPELKKIAKETKKTQETIRKRFRSINDGLIALKRAESRDEVRSAAQALTPLFAQMMREMSEAEAGQFNPKPNYVQDRAEPIKPSELRAPPASYALVEHPRVMVASIAGVSVTDLPAPPLVAPEASSCNYATEDLQGSDGIDLHVTDPAIRQLAAELQYSPVRIFQYVRNEIAYQPYYGSIKGDLGTLISRSGNDIDQASLVISLLRASNYPARYVRGNVRMSAVRAQNWLGTRGLGGTLSYLGDGRIPVSAYGSSIDFEHVWVEACVPYGNYRGANIDTSNNRWIPLDTSIKTAEYQPGITVFTPYSLDDYIAKYSQTLPLEILQKKIEQQVKGMAPYYTNNSLADVPYLPRYTPLLLDVLPISVPFGVNSFLPWNGSSSEIALLPDSFRVKVELKFGEEQVVTLPLPRIVTQRVTLRFNGVTDADKTALDTWRNGSVDAKVACTVNVVPDLLVEGVSEFVGVKPLGICTSKPLTVTIRVSGNFTAPLTLNESTFPNIKGEGYYALGLYRYEISDQLLATRVKKFGQATLLPVVCRGACPSSDARAMADNLRDVTLGEYLHIVGLKYLRYVSDATRDIGRYYGSSGLSGMHLGIIGAQAKVLTALGSPYGISACALYVDFPRVINRSAGLETGNVLTMDEFLAVGAAGSAYEHYVWQENARVDAISTIRGLQYAKTTGIEIITFKNRTDWNNNKSKICTVASSLCPTKLLYDAGTITSIETAFINKDYTVVMPAQRLQYGTWLGYVYHAYKSTSLELIATYAIEGGYSGGYTSSYLPSSPSFDSITNSGYSSYCGSCYSSTPTSTGTSGSSSTAPLIFADAPPAQINDGIGMGMSPYNTVGGDPVNLVTGNMYLTERDFEIKGRGLPIVFERTYNSRSAESSSLGKGWTHTFNQYLMFKDENKNGTIDTPDTDGLTSTVIWVDGTGAVKSMEVAGNSDGVPVGAAITTPKGFFYRTSRESSGEYKITERNGIVYTFESVPGKPPTSTTPGDIAKLKTITDRYGNSLTLNYASGVLSTVQDAVGRTLTFGYSSVAGTSRLSMVNDWSGRQFNYGYDTSGALVSTWVTGLAQQPSTYTYSQYGMHSHRKPNGNGITFEYYPDGRVFRHTNSAGESMVFSYNDFRRESTTVNERGFTRRFFFNENGLPVRIVDEAGGTTTYEYTHASDPFLQTAKVDVLGYRTTYAYDASGNLTTVTNPSNTTMTYDYYNAFGQPGRVKNPNGNYTLFKYDANGNRTDTLALKAGVGSSINPTTYTPAATDLVAWSINGYDSFGNLTSTKQVRNFGTKEGPTQTFGYNDTLNNVAGLNVVSVTRCGDKDGDGVINTAGADACDTAVQSYDALGRMKTGIRADWYPVQYEYDVLNRVTRATDGFGKLRDIAFDANSNSASEKFVENGVTLDQTTAFFDAADRRVYARDNAGYYTNFLYDAAGNVTRTTNPDGYSVGFGYDPMNRWVIAYDEAGRSVSRTLDLNGKPRTVTDPNGSSTKFEYYGPEKDGRLKRQTDAVGRITEFDYDANGNVVRVYQGGRDSAGYDDGRDTRTIFYDELNRAVRVVTPTVPLNNTSARVVYKYVYDTLGRNTEVWAGYTTDFTGVSTTSDVLTRQATYVYDDFGRKLKEHTPLTESFPLYYTWVASYDRHGNPQRVTDPKGQITEFTYYYGGAVDTRTVYKSAVDTSPHITKHVRNSFGQATQIQAPEVTYGYGFNPATHRLDSVNDSRGNKTLRYSYSPGGLLNSVDEGEGRQVNYLYDPVRRLTGIWAPNGDIVTYIYDQGGRLTEKWFPNGANTRYAYNADNTLKQLLNRTFNGSVISQHDYGYDRYGNRDSQVEKINNVTKSFKYVYDNLNRLQEVDDAAASNALIEKYAYDAFGNRKSKTNSSGTMEYEYSIANRLTLAASTDGLVTYFYGYDANGNMTDRIDNNNGCFAHDGCNPVTLEYDALNRLTRVNKSGQPPETYTYGPDGNRIAKQVGATTTNYLYNGPDIIAEYNNGWSNASATTTHGPFMDDPLLRTTSSGTQYYHQDGLGSVVAMTNATQAVAGTQRFDAWGNVLSSTGSIAQYGYTGREPDATGLIYYRARYYDPSVGRFTQPDPLGFVDGVNRYAYAINNPVNFVDPWGTSKASPSVNNGGSYYSQPLPDHPAQTSAVTPLINSEVAAQIANSAGQLSDMTGMAAAMSAVAGQEYAAVVFGAISLTSLGVQQILNVDPQSFTVEAMQEIAVDLAPGMVKIPAEAALTILNNQLENEKQAAGNK